VAGDPFGEAVVGRPVLEPPAGDAPEPEEDSGERREEDRAAVERAEDEEGLPRRLLVDPRPSGERGPRGDEGGRAGASCELVSRAKNAAILSSRSSPVVSRMMLARAAAVMAGCFVARMRPNACMRRKLTA
jgi:hypothetical protein